MPEQPRTSPPPALHRVRLRSLGITYVLLLALQGTAAAQQADGVQVRLRPRGAASPWIEGRMRALGADSVSLALPRGAERLHLRPEEAWLERAEGRNYRGAVARGALIGAAVLLAVPLIAGENIYQGKGVLLAPAMASFGGALGAGAGLLLAPSRWVPLQPDPPACSRWTLTVGSAVLLRRGETSLRGEIRQHTRERLTLVAPGRDSVLLDLDLGAGSAEAEAWRVELSGVRDRRRAAAVGALVLGGIGIIGAATDESVSTLDAIFGIGGNTAIGAALGAWWAPLRRHPIALRCPAA